MGATAVFQENKETSQISRPGDEAYLKDVLCASAKRLNRLVPCGSSVVKKCGDNDYDVTKVKAFRADDRTLCLDFYESKRATSKRIAAIRYNLIISDSDEPGNGTPSISLTIWYSNSTLFGMVTKDSTEQIPYENAVLLSEVLITQFENLLRNKYS